MVRGKAKRGGKPANQVQEEGRGRGRPRRIPLATFGSSIAKRADEELNQTVISPNLITHLSATNNSPSECHTEVAKNLILSPQTSMEVTGVSATSMTTTNRTVTPTPKEGELNKVKVNEETIGEQKEEDYPDETWVNLFKHNRVATNGMNLSYIPPLVVDGVPVVQLEEADVNIEIDKWKCALIVYFFGNCPGYNAMVRYIAHNWPNVAEPDIYLHEEGYYIIKFKTIEDMHEILYAGPYTINNRPMILKSWTMHFDLSSEFMAEIPLWVRFPKLPLNCWGCGSLSRIVSAIGAPLFADECTTKQIRISYARILIEVNVTRPLSMEITVMDPSGHQFRLSMNGNQSSVQCQKVGYVCPEQRPVPTQEPPKKQRHGKHVAQEWKYKGIIIPATKEPRDKIQDEARLDILENNLGSPTTQTRKEDFVVSKNKSPTKLPPKSPEFNLINFPALTFAANKNSFSVLAQGNCDIAGLPIDRGGTSFSTV
ncbi:hypothetical protein R3W88_019435 [Solanum pinnatisectum]|uniref:DUF4283 domain-containing protein n=1 Tax=Solanum pinnatisectum TaxID=50273 RepID=A0AAV9KJ82_9SOLN|nr:hypothetical protein R3W88_019435 [Solanum pinnatisectum]